LSVDELTKTYENEYLVFKKTGILPDGIIRKIASLIKEAIGEPRDVKFAEALFIGRCAEVFYFQNKK
jgi:hypothetical protein